MSKKKLMIVFNFLLFVNIFNIKAMGSSENDTGGNNTGSNNTGGNDTGTDTTELKDKKRNADLEVLELKKVSHLSKIQNEELDDIAIKINKATSTDEIDNLLKKAKEITEFSKIDHSSKKQDEKKEDKEKKRIEEAEIGKYKEDKNEKKNTQKEEKAALIAKRASEKNKQKEDSKRNTEVELALLEKKKNNKENEKQEEEAAAKQEAVKKKQKETIAIGLDKKHIDNKNATEAQQEAAKKANKEKEAALVAADEKKKNNNNNGNKHTREIEATVIIKKKKEKEEEEHQRQAAAKDAEEKARRTKADAKKISKKTEIEYKNMSERLKKKGIKVYNIEKDNVNASMKILNKAESGVFGSVITAFTQEGFDALIKNAKTSFNASGVIVIFGRQVDTGSNPNAEGKELVSVENALFMSNVLSLLKKYRILTVFVDSYPYDGQLIIINELKADYNSHVSTLISKIEDTGTVAPSTQMTSGANAWNNGNITNDNALNQLIFNGINSFVSQYNIKPTNEPEKLKIPKKPIHA